MEDDQIKPVDDQNKPADVQENLLTIDQFMKVDLRVAVIKTVERVPGTTKLLKMQVDLGSEERQLVAGIATAYEPDSLVGKRIIVVTNLKPARIRGVESLGMLLAADLDGKPIVATFEEEVPAGTRIR